jgi:hypothetical protein
MASARHSLTTRWRARRGRLRRLIIPTSSPFMKLAWLHRVSPKFNSHSPAGDIELAQPSKNEVMSRGHKIFLKTLPR